MSWDDSEPDDDLFGGVDDAPATGGGNWNDESEDDVGGDWDAESGGEEEKKEEKKAPPAAAKESGGEEEKKEEKKAPPAAAKPKKKSKRQILAEKEAKEMEAKRAKERYNKAFNNMTADQREAYDRAQERNKERTELAVAGDLFDGCDDVMVDIGEADDGGFMAPPDMDLNHPAYQPVVVEKELKLESKKDHEAYARECITTLADRKSNKTNISAFVRVVLQEGCKTLTLDQVTSLKNSLNLIHKEKIKAQRNDTKKKKNKKPTANVSHDDYYDSSYDVGGDFDFI